MPSTSINIYNNMSPSLFKEGLGVVITTPSLLAKKGLREVNTREATTCHEPHTTPANRQDIDHPALFKEGLRVVKKTRHTPNRPHRGEVGI
jgi:hypothetical protein